MSDSGNTSRETSPAASPATPPPPAAPPAVPPSGGFPARVGFILGNEACERFSYYGMKSLLALYATKMLLMKDDDATSIIHWFGVGCYAMPLVGGWISDRFWGRYKTILWVSLLYCAGHGVLACSELSASVGFKVACLYAGLLLIAVGSGGIKPCVSAFMGDQFGPSQAHLLPRAYSAFYWCINFGSLGSFLIIPWIKEHHGYAWAFGIPGILMGIATLIFWLGTRHYTILPPASRLPDAERRTGFWEILFFALSRRGHCPGDSFWAAARRRYKVGEVDDVAATCGMLWIFLFIPPFFALFDQASSTWVLQGEKMAPIDMGFFTVGAEQMQSANPAMVMLLIPLFTLCVYPLLGKFATPVRRLSLGMFLTAFSFVLVGLLQQHVETQPAGAVSLAWQLGPYLVLTAGEVLVSATGLEFAFTQAPKTMKSTLTGLWLFSAAAGNFLVVLVTRFADLFGGATEAASGASSVSSGRFYFYAGMMAVTAVLFAIAVSFYKERRDSATVA